MWEGMLSADKRLIGERAVGLKRKAFAKIQFVLCGSRWTARGRALAIAAGRIGESVTFVQRFFGVLKMCLHGALQIDGRKQWESGYAEVQRW